MNEDSEAGPLAGRTIALLETREAERLGQMLREQGAEIVSVPAVAIVDVDKDKLQKLLNSKAKPACPNMTP